MPFRLITFGHLRAMRNGADVDWLHGQRLRAALLTYVAVERRVTRDTLAALFWPDSDEANARHALRQNLLELRKAIGEEWEARRGQEIVATDVVHTDVDDFASALAAEDWPRLADVYAGPFLESVHLVTAKPWTSWVDGKRASFTVAYRKACRRWVDACIASGDLEGACVAATRWVTPDPTDDEAQHRLLHALISAGERTEAIRRYEAYERLLDADGLAPLEETTAMMAELRRGGGGAAAWPVAHAAAPRGAAPAPGDVLPGGPDFVNDLEILRSIGEGEAATVYLALERELNRHVAVKVLSAEWATDDTAAKRFEREARVAARIQHPHVATVYRVGRLPSGLPFLVMPYIDGGSLADRLAATGPLPLDVARRLLRQIASALAAAHRLGVVHRDVRPANILYDRETDRFLLTDFGIAAIQDLGAAARLTRENERLGMPSYVSPEQLRGEPLTEQSDIYSLGVVLFEALAGRLPFSADNPRDLIGAHLKGVPRDIEADRPDVTPDLAGVIRRCLDRAPARRPFAGDLVEGTAR